MAKQAEQRSQEHNWDELVEEHAQVRDILQQIHNTLALRQSGPQNVTEQLGELKEHVQRHFAHEEAGGYFADVIAEAPRLTATVDALLQQHSEFVQILDGMRESLRRGSNSNESWDGTASQFDEFVRQFLKHERAEVRLVQEAFCRDIGTGE
jgi:hemerythrin